MATGSLLLLVSPGKLGSELLQVAFTGSAVKCTSVVPGEPGKVLFQAVPTWRLVRLLVVSPGKPWKPGGKASTA